MRNVVYLSDRSDNGSENGEFAVALPRLEQELSRHPDHDDNRPWIEQVTDAINAANGELLFVLPDPDEDGAIRQRAMIRLQEEEEDCLVYLCQAEDGFVLKTGEQIETHLAEFARATANVMQHLRADENVLRPLAEGVH